MTSLFSVLGQTMPEKEEVSLNKDIGIGFTSKLLRSKGLCILSQFAISKVNQRLHCPNIDSSLLTIVKKKLTPVHAFFDVGAIFFIDMRQLLTSAWSPDDGVICCSFIPHQIISIHWGDSAQFNLAPRLQVETLFANCAVNGNVQYNN